MADNTSEQSAGSAECVELLPQVPKLQRSLSDPGKAGLQHHIINLEGCGPISIYVQGDFEKRRSGNVFMTIHNVGSSFQSMVDFVNHEDMAQLKDRCLFLHVSVYGQSHKAPDLTHTFPSLQDIGMNLVTVLDQMSIKEVVVIGDGAGANIALRFGLYHPTRTAGLVLMNCTGTESNKTMMDSIMSTIWGADRTADDPELNKSNVSKYSDAFGLRTNMLEQLAERINFDVLLLAGNKFALVEDSQEIYSYIKPGKASFIRVDDVTEPLKEAQEKLADAIILFCQGLGWMPTILRKVSRGEQQHLTRRISMEQYDTPNVRRLSLVSK